LFDDVPGESIKSVKPPIGKTKLKACTYTDKRCSIGEQGCQTVTVDFLDCDGPTSPIVAPVPAPVEAPVAEPTSCDNGNEIVGFELVDAENPKAPIITPFKPPMINLLDFPTCELNIFAIGKNNTCGNPPIACVRVSLGSSVRRERFVPYALFGDRTGWIVYDRKPELGPNTLKACTYTDRNCREGEQGCLEVDVNVEDCDRPTSTPTITPVAATDAPSVAPAIAESDAPSRAPIPLSPTAIVRVTDYYIAFVAPAATREPTEDEYNEMLRRITEYFVDIFTAMNDADTEFVSIDSSIDFRLYGDGAVIPRFNIYMNFDFSNFIYTETSVVPTVAEIFDILRYSINQEFILDIVRTYTGTPFESTNEVKFAASEFVGPPAF
jgi:hypothetical protein